MRRKLSELGGDARGAVLVEFLVAVMPLCVTFFSFWQVTQVARARLVVKHATVVAARGAAVISNGNGNTPDQKNGDNKAVIEAAVKAALGPWAKTMSSINVTINDSSSCDDPYGAVSVTVDAQYKCQVPLGNRIVCDTGGATHQISETLSYPHQGARYADGGGAKCD